MFEGAKFYDFDCNSTLFPLSCSREIIRSGAELLEEALVSRKKSRQERVFGRQVVAYADKAELQLRRTPKLDPLAEYFLYSRVNAVRQQLYPAESENRRSFGYRFDNNRPVRGTVSYGRFRHAMKDVRSKFRHGLVVDVASYFNSIRRSDLDAWLATRVQDSDLQSDFSRLFDDTANGLSVDCLPHGYYPAKMLGSGFLSFIEEEQTLGSASVRFMDDIYLFAGRAGQVKEALYSVQRDLGQRGLSLNDGKTKFTDHYFGADRTAEPNKFKVQLLQLRRGRLRVSGHGVFADDSEGEDTAEVETLTEEQREYLVSLLRTPDLAEHDAELVLTVLEDKEGEVLELLPDLMVMFPHLAQRIHKFCSKLDDVEGVANVVLDFVRSGRATEFQLFWCGCMVGDYLGDTGSAEELIEALHEAGRATSISRARLLEIPSDRFGLPERRNAVLRSGAESWEAWAAARGALCARAGEETAVDASAGNSSVNRLFINCLRKRHGKGAPAF